MAKIVAFSVPGITDGETALHELDGVEGAVPAVEGKVRALSNLRQYNGVIEVGDFPADAQKEVREALKQYAAA